MVISDTETEDGEGEAPIWDPGWDPFIGFLDRPCPLSMPPQVQKSFGPINQPKRKSDQEKLRALFEICRGGNIREARMVLFHQAYLLPYTDEYGFTALHHAQLSKNAEFYAELLQLFQDPRTFQKKMVWYESPEALRDDGMVVNRELDADRTDGGLVTVRQVRQGSLASWSGVVAGDRLEAVFTEALCKKKLRKIMEETVNIINNGALPGGAEKNFPIAFEFRGPACRDILAEGMAALYNANKRQHRRKKQHKPGAGWDKVVKTKPAYPDVLCLPKKKTAAHPHDTVLPTLLVREGSKPQKAWCHPLAPILDARVASGRAAARVTAVRQAARRSQSVGAAREGDASSPSHLVKSVSLPALAAGDSPEAEPAPNFGQPHMAKALLPSVQPTSPTWSRRHWLPEAVQALNTANAVPIKAPRLSQATSSPTLNFASPTIKFEAAQHSLLF